MLRISSKFASYSVVARTMSAALGLFLLSSLSLPTTGCGAFGLTYSLTGLTVEPAYGDTCVYAGGAAQYHAYGTYTEGGHAAKTQDITDSVSWSLTFPAFGSISSSGLLTTNTNVSGTSGIGAAIQGEFGELHATSNIEVPCPSSTTSPSLSVVPAVATLKSIGDTEQPLAIGILPAGHGTVDLSSKVTWISSDLAVATVDPNGVIRAVGPGTAVITAHETTPDGRVLAATQTVTFQAAQNQ